MTAVRGDLIAKVLGSAYVDPATLTADEWYEILVRVSQFLTARTLRRMRTLRGTIVSCDVPSGIPSQVGDQVLELALPTELNPNTAFLTCASIALRPDKLPGEAKHILMSRNLDFYELRILWNIRRPAPTEPRYYDATKAVLEPRDLRGILNDYSTLRLGSKKDWLFGQWMLWAFVNAQRETVDDLETELSQSREALSQIGRVHNVLRTTIAPVDA